MILIGKIIFLKDLSLDDSKFLYFVRKQILHIFIRNDDFAKYRKTF